MLLPLLGRIGGPKVYTLIEAAMASGDAQRRAAGLSALCNWPDARAADDLLKLAETAKDKDNRLRFLCPSPAWWPSAATAPPPR